MVTLAMANDAFSLANGPWIPGLDIPSPSAPGAPGVQLPMHNNKCQFI